MFIFNVNKSLFQITGKHSLSGIFFLFMDKCDLIECSTLLLQKGFLNKYVKNVFWGLLLKGVHKNSFCALIVNFVMRMMQICLCRVFLLFFSITASRQPTESYYAVFCIFTEIIMDSFGFFFCWFLKTSCEVYTELWLLHTATPYCTAGGMACHLGDHHRRSEATIYSHNPP